jgi:hypothetical protein
MPPITSREYKVMLDHRMFAVRKDGLREIRRELKRLARSMGIDAEGQFDKVEKRTIRFLDTPDMTIRRNRLILRLRRDFDASDRGAYTLKCRTEDRYLAAGINLQPADGIGGKSKFEEDIAAPFCSRFSKSITVDSQSESMPDCIAPVAEIFPILGQLPRDGGICNVQTPLAVVGNLVPHERVHKGLKFDFSPTSRASVAVILWANSWKGRITCAELSFRYGNNDEEYTVDTAERAFGLFAAIQKFDWCMPESPSKTQVAYGGEA